RLLDAVAVVVRGAAPPAPAPEEGLLSALYRLPQDFGNRPTEATPSFRSDAGTPPPAPASLPQRDGGGDAYDFLGPPQEADELGRFGPYGILRTLGRGGMGIVFAARQVRPQRLVALKMIQAGSGAGRKRLARFRSETEIVATLQHPNIVPIYEVGEQDGRPYFTMEYVKGGSLAQKLAVAPLPARAAAELPETLAQTVHFAHQHGVVHRDLKPANVLLTDTGLPKVVDFGLAKQFPGDSAANVPGGQTESGAILGTPAYMAPEQATGNSADAGRSADVYALGAILYEC